MGGATRRLETVARAFEIIEILWEENGASLAELSQLMDIPKSTAHGYLCTLESTGFATYEDNEYKLGYQFLTVGGRLLHRSGFFHAARPEMQRVAAETGELPNISVEENGECVILHSVRGDQSLALGLYPGVRVPIHTQAAGKVLLAYMSEQEVKAILSSKNLEKITENTTTDSDVLMNEINDIQEQGYAYDWDEQVLGMGTVAVPILSQNNIIGSFAISCPTGRIQNREYRDELIQQAREAANAITVSYQYRF